jgi:hypothetical protein
MCSTKTMFSSPSSVAMLSSTGPTSAIRSCNAKPGTSWPHGTQRA